MPRRYVLYLEDILDAAKRIQEYADNMTYDALITDRMRLDAIVRNMEIVGEAAGKIPQEIQLKHPSIDGARSLI